DLETPNYSLRRVRDDETTLPENSGTSYKLVTPKPDPSVAFEEIKKPQRTEEAAVSNLLPSTPVPTPPPPSEPPAGAPDAPRPARAAPRGRPPRHVGRCSAVCSAGSPRLPRVRKRRRPRRAPRTRSGAARTAIIRVAATGIAIASRARSTAIIGATATAIG